MKTVYILYSCDEWKSHSSFSVISVLTSLTKLRNAVCHELSMGCMEVGDGMRIGKTVGEINTALVYGHVEEINTDVIGGFSVTG